MEIKANLLEFFVIIVPWIAAVGWLSSRVLGIRLGRWRSTLVAVVGWVGGLVCTGVIVDRHTAVAVVVPMTLFFGVVVAMPTAIVLDLITRSTRTTPRRTRLRRKLLHPVRSTKNAFAPIGRMRELVKDARRHNLVHVRYRSEHAVDTADFAHRLRLTIEDAGGMMVKFGQIASTRTDLLPDTLTTELANLQSSVRPIDAEAVRDVIESAFDEPVETTFAEFEWEPLAAASIGQTHRAVLVTGERVVVKVQRPGVADLVDRDAAVMRLVARQAERRIAAARRISAGALADELINGIESELDYLDEANAGRRFAKNLDDTDVRVPGVFPTLCASTVLVMEEVPGRSIADTAAVDACGVPREELARRLLRSFLRQILRDGLYHADPHPGNVFIDAQGGLWLIDFGAVGTVSPALLEGLQGIAIGMATQNVSLVARGVRHLAGDDATTDLRSLESDLGAVLTEMGSGFDPKLMNSVLGVMDRHGLHVPSALTLLSRSLLTLEGTLGVLCPGFDFAGTGTELARDDASETLGPPEEIVQRELVRALPSLRTLPEAMEAISGQLRAGRLTVRTEHYSGRDRAVVDRWMSQALVAFSGGAGALASAALLIAAGGTHAEDVRQTLWVLGFGGLTFSSTLLMRTVAQAMHRLPLRDE
ncbi:MAG: ABC1 kinase family protein [Acidimicrobiia bacterium]